MMACNSGDFLQASSLFEAREPAQIQVRLPFLKAEEMAVLALRPMSPSFQLMKGQIGPKAEGGGGGGTMHNYQDKG